ncbi:unnamed protein product [Toxocara canis]|uniref:Golgin-84 n=1 Tax=Toxocara canis TaxID=6265 RepID=A0A183VFN9_TOXCA|nr:unnamed protein product [Toxocara canis]
MGFTHDEKKSPFEQVRSLSQSSRSSTTTPANVMVNIGDDEEGEHFNFKTPSTQQTNDLDHHQESELNSNYMVHQNGTARPLNNAKEDRDEMAKALNEAVMEKNRLASQLAELAMSVVVKEKTSLQLQLREATEANEQSVQRIQSIEAELNKRTIRLAKAEAELSSMKREIESLSALVQREAEELESSRREAANWQARERLKLCMKESEIAQAELQEARKQLHLKEIYLRQLGAYNAGPAFSEDDIQNLQGENERLKGQVLKLEMEKEQLRKEAQAAKEHYEAYGTQLNQNVVQISAKPGGLACVLCI